MFKRSDGTLETPYYFTGMEGELACYDYDAVIPDDNVITLVKRAGSRGLPKPIEYAIPKPPRAGR